MNSGNAMKNTVLTFNAGMLHGQRFIDTTIPSIATNWQHAQTTSSSYSQAPKFSQPTNVYTQPTPFMHAQPPSSSYSQAPNFSQPTNVYTQPTPSMHTQPPSSTYSQAPNLTTNVPANTFTCTSTAPDIASAPQNNVSSFQNPNEVPNYPPMYPNMVAAPNYVQQQLNSNQFAARHALPKELPTFSGKPEEWPIFFSSFEGTTRTCGFWAIFQQTVPSPNLSTLSQWLFQIAQAASTVAIPLQTQSIDKPDQRSTTQHKGHVLAHSNSDSQPKEETKMEDLDRRQRWKRVIDNKLCRRCLQKHLSSRCKLTSFVERMAVNEDTTRSYITMIQKAQQIRR